MIKENTKTIASQIDEIKIVPGLQLFVMPTQAKKIVTIEGSMLGGEYCSPEENRSIAGIMSAMLDQGTLSRSKREIHDLLDARGISIGFSTSKFKLHFSVQCLSEDIALAVELLGDMLQNPTFPEMELVTLKKRVAGRLKELSTNTREQASIALSRELFTEDHPNYSPTTNDEIACIEKVSRKELVSFHKKIGLGNMIVVGVGDINIKSFAKEIAKRFTGFQKTDFVIPKIAPSKATVQKTIYIKIKDKTSSDILIGTTIPLGDKHPDFYPLLMANMVFGATPTSRLMKEVRENKGLTYGTYSYIAGVSDDTPGYFAIWATFAPELLKNGSNALTTELKKLLMKGIGEKELAQKKETVTGGYKVGLSTTAGLASVILSNAEMGRPKEFIDEYPRFIKKITLAKVNGAIKKYLARNKFVTAVAGTI